MHAPLFVQGHRKAADALLREEAVSEPIFSRGTYQFEVQEKGRKKAFPFLQLTDEGEVTDCFCSCKLSESGHGCPHLAASFLQIFHETPVPLHVRYQNSFWNHLFQMESGRHGYSPACLANQDSFSIEATTPGAKKRLHEILAERPVETEETSIKFLNLPAEELVRYREGKGSPFLLHELSFWSDLAKWLMILQDQGEPYKIAFEGEGLPEKVVITFPGLKITSHLSMAEWPLLIPSLPTIHSPLKVWDAEEESIEKITYHSLEESLEIHHRKAAMQHQGVQVGDWVYVEGEGFYRQGADPLLSQSKISKEQMAAVLTSSTKTLQRFLPIFPDTCKAQYQLFFDRKADLHLAVYVFEPGDVEAIFAPWVYVRARGFYHLEEWLFDGKEKVVPRKEVADFVNKHRLWLHNFPGFQTHLGSLESHLTYHLSSEGDLSFEAELSFPEEHEKILHFDEWVYIQGQGFYMKKESRGRLPLHPGLKVRKQEVASFLAQHRDDLEQVQGFYSSELPIEKMGLEVKVNEEGKIALSPKIEYAERVDPGQLQWFGSFVYRKGKGFSEIPAPIRLPERYQHPTLLPVAQEAPFLAYELEPLKPYILELDPRLIVPEELHLKIRKMAPRKGKRGREWWIDFVYVSSAGSVDLFAIWDAFQEKKRHLFSAAGLLYLKEPRFQWIRQLSKKQLDRKKGWVRINTLEWIRLTVFESIQEPHDRDAKAFFRELTSLETDRLLDLSQLKSTLRPYQEQGVHWLWFLYCHGLSGLLCDDMGLGKTHQAMALLAAVSQEEKEHKYLVVCPTSVIYHWQELLKRFLPHIRVCTYYGLERSLENFEEQYDLLLTSYGILRTGKENLKGYRFEVAIFDEIQIAKNHVSQTHKALRSVQAQMRLGLTGTPIENRIRELKSLIDIALPSYLPPDPIFRDLFIHPIEKHQDAEKKKLLGQLVKPFLLRRKKSEVLTDLPEKIEEISYCDLSPEQKELYKQIAFQMRDTVYQDLRNSEKPVSFVHIFSALSSLKRICDHPALFLDDAKNYPAHQSGKWELFLELLNEARDSGQKVVIFSQYLDMLAIIENHLKKKGIQFASIKGSTKDRPEQLRRFREDPACEVFVASLLAAGVGIDLTVASIVIHYDRWWNPAKENQATDRVHRIGQNRGVQVFKLVTKNTIEEHIHEMIERKKGLLEHIIGTEDQITYLSRDELLQVFERMFSELE